MMPSLNRKQILIIFLFITVLALTWSLRYVREEEKNIQEAFITRKEIRYPERGLITDRHGNILVGNETQYDLLVVPAEVGRIDTGRFCRLLGISRWEFDRQLQIAGKFSLHKTSVFKKQVSIERMTVLRNELAAYPGFYERQRTIRRYPDSVAAHVLGFANIISPQTLKGTYGYSQPGEPAGRSGLEAVYDSLLRGKTGTGYIRFDPEGHYLGAFDEGRMDTPVVAGKSLITGIDLELQLLAEKLMKNKVGSIVAIDPSSGEILTYLGSPDYDPNLLSGLQTTANLRTLRNDSLHRLMNRPVRSRISPGSSLKPVIALIALQQGIIKPTDVFFCPQYYMAGERRLACEHFDGRVDLRKGIAQSCNTYFFNVFNRQMASNRAGARASYEAWRTSLSLFGLGNRLGVDLPGETPGYLPPASFYDKMYETASWSANDIISLGIGQGELEVTPLQLANTQCIIANRGYYFTPHLLSATTDTTLPQPQWTEKHVVPIDTNHFTPVIDGMQDAVENGTAAGIRIPGIIFCGKTGTVQNSRGKSHSVFAGFAPRNQPKIAIAVIVENAGYGASYAAPIASYLVEKYLTGKITKPAGQVEWMTAQNLLPGSTGDTPD
jgi:penicillin-binding protein 2